MKKFIWMFIVFFLLSISGLNYASAAATTSELTNKKALDLALSARQHFWNVKNGHDPSVKTNCTFKTITIKEEEYRFFCEEFNTKVKLVKYMNEVYTHNAINKSIKQFKFMEYKGKMIQPNADGGSLLAWEKAKGRLIFSKKDVRLFEYIVPLGDIKEAEIRRVTYVKVGKEWKINDVNAVR